MTSIHKKIPPLFMVFCLVVSLLPSQLAFADANQLFLKEQFLTKNINDVFTIEVKSLVDSAMPLGTDGTAVGTLTYSPSMLSVVGTSTSGSSYGSPTISPSTGAIGFNASRNPDTNGTAKIFSVTFKAVGSGAASVNFSPDSKVNGAAATPKNGVYTINNPTPPSSPPPSTTIPKPSTSSKPSPTPSESATPAPQVTPDPAGLVDTVNVNPLYSSSTVTWRVNAANPTTSLSYGTNSLQLDKQATVTRNADGTFVAKITDLTPGIRYLFTISATGDGGKNGAYSGTMSMRGFPVSLTITENNQPAKSGQVKIGNQSAFISTPGKLTIGLAAGTYSGTITTDTASMAISLTVAAKPIPSDDSAPATQTFAFNLTSSSPIGGPGSGFTILTFIGVLFGGLVLLGAGFMVFVSYRRRRFEAEDPGVTYRSSTPTVVIDDGYDWKSQQPQPGDQSSKSSDSETSTTMPKNRHRNSVYLSEEEPLDMFDKATDKVPSQSSTKETTSEEELELETEHTPSSPHSTTP